MDPWFYTHSRLTIGLRRPIDNNFSSEEKEMDWRDLRHVQGVRGKSPSRLHVVVFALIITAIGFSPAAAQDGLPELRSAHDGVYTLEQAAMGEELFQTICSDCHNGSYPLHGRDFQRTWTGQPLWRLYEYMSWNMPYGAAASLSAEQYTALTAYILQKNEYPAGDTPIPEDQLGIAFINLDPHDPR
jgi:mono/diheme cytochrome c family protein